jgi:hypothetical protein
MATGMGIASISAAANDAHSSRELVRATRVVDTSRSARHTVPPMHTFPTGVAEWNTVSICTMSPLVVPQYNDVDEALKEIGIASRYNDG